MEFVLGATQEEKRIPPSEARPNKQTRTGSKGETKNNDLRKDANQPTIEDLISNSKTQGSG